MQITLRKNHITKTYKFFFHKNKTNLFIHFKKITYDNDK